MENRAPVIVGAGQVTNRGTRPVEPLELMEEAARTALEDAGGRIARRIGSVQIVNILSWSYPDPAGALAERLGLPEGERLTTTIGGNTPQWLVSRACDEIAAGRVDAVLIAGAEALDTALRARRWGTRLERGDRTAANRCVTIGDERSGAGPLESSLGLVPPSTHYPIFESALAARAGRDPTAQRTHLGEIMAPFTAVAATHPHLAWFPQESSPRELAQTAGGNRLVAEPYTKRMNAIIRVDQGAALLVASMEAARAAGVPAERIVYPWAGAECDDVYLPSRRPELHRSPGIETAAERAFEAAGIGSDDIAAFDLYSCFPSAVQIAADALGLDVRDPRGLTVTGGLPYFGGPGNNYVTHAIATMVDRCRREPGSVGLVTGMGWYVTKHAVGIYSATPPAGGWRHPHLATDQARIDATAIEVADDYEGAAEVEAMTVVHDREEGPVAAPLFARLPDGRRLGALPADPALPRELSGRSLVGGEVSVRRGAEGLAYEPV